MLTHHALTERVIGLAIAVHKELGPELPEPVYETCLTLELKGGAFRSVGRPRFRLRTVAFVCAPDFA